MKRLLFIALAFLPSSYALSQSHDYRRLRPSLGLLSCGLADSTTIRGNYQKLLQVDTAFYHQHLEVYLQDLAMACYKMSFATKDKSYLEKEVLLLKMALSLDPKSETARWNYLFALFLLKRCDEAKSQLTYYLSHVAKARIDNEQVRSIRASCP